MIPPRHCSNTGRVTSNNPVPKTCMARQRLLDAATERYALILACAWGTLTIIDTRLHHIDRFIKLKGVARAVLETTKRVQPKDAKQLASILDIAVPMMNPVKTRKRTGEVSVATLYDKVCSTRKHVGAKAGAGAAAARKKAARKKVVQKSPVPKVAIVDLPQQKRKRTK